MLTIQETKEINKRISEVERTCENCQDYIICEMNNTLKENCPSWQIDFELFQTITQDIFKKYSK